MSIQAPPESSGQHEVTMARYGKLNRIIAYVGCAPGSSDFEILGKDKVTSGVLSLEEWLRLTAKFSVVNQNTPGDNSQEEKDAEGKKDKSPMDLVSIPSRTLKRQRETLLARCVVPRLDGPSQNSTNEVERTPPKRRRISERHKPSLAGPSPLRGQISMDDDSRDLSWNFMPSPLSSISSDSSPKSVVAKSDRVLRSRKS